MSDKWSLLHQQWIHGLEDKYIETYRLIIEALVRFEDKLENKEFSNETKALIAGSIMALKNASIGTGGGRPSDYYSGNLTQIENRFGLYYNKDGTFRFTIPFKMFKNDFASLYFCMLTRSYIFDTAIFGGDYSSFKILPLVDIAKILYFRDPQQMAFDEVEEKVIQLRNSQDIARYINDRGFLSRNLETTSQKFIPHALYHPWFLNINGDQFNIQGKEELILRLMLSYSYDSQFLFETGFRNINFTEREECLGLIDRNPDFVHINEQIQKKLKQNHCSATRLTNLGKLFVALSEKVGIRTSEFLAEITPETANPTSWKVDSAKMQNAFGNYPDIARSYVEKGKIPIFDFVALLTKINQGENYLMLPFDIMMVMKLFNLNQENCDFSVSGNRVFDESIIKSDGEKGILVVSELDPNPAFSKEAFNLLKGLHEGKTRFYERHKADLKQYVQIPFKSLFTDIISILPAEITNIMETEKRIFARFKKNDFGRQGVWEHYWGAIYSKGGVRIKDAQLFMWINYEHLGCGFYVGQSGDRQRKQFVDNCKKYREELISLLSPVFAEGAWEFGARKDFIGSDYASSASGPSSKLENWLNDIDSHDFRVSTAFTEDQILRMSFDSLRDLIADLLKKVFPFVLLLASDDPMPAVREYVKRIPGGTMTNEDLSLGACAEESGLEEELLASWIRAIERKNHAIIYGPPGTGKTFVAELLARHLVGGGDGFSELIQFHPEYAYEDFMQGIRPKPDAQGKLTYPIVPGRFLEFCEKARSRQGICVLVIDEINRANPSRVFGELMYLLEYRNKKMVLSSGFIEEAKREKFSIPENVRIIGTMNTADRSIALVDHALRRRFAFLSLRPNYDILRKFHQKHQTGFSVDGLIGVLNNVNNQIGDRHYEVGITFFLKVKLSEQIEDIWKMEIEPYLEEFFFDQPERTDEFRWEEVKNKINR
ncbi:McrB family protein [Candidatus Omnitrophota bacterium]